MSSAIKTRLKADALSLGFHDLCVTDRLQNNDAAKFLDQFINNGHHGDMQWMEAHSDRRRSPNALWSEARSAVLVAMSYTPGNRSA